MGEVDGGLDCSLQVEDEDILDVEVVELARIAVRYVCDSTHATVYGGDFGQNQISLNHGVVSPAPARRGHVLV